MCRIWGDDVSDIKLLLDGGSQRQKSNKYNLHVFLTSVKTEGRSAGLHRKPLTSENKMQSNH